jgi:hypothetical protein
MRPPVWRPRIKPSPAEQTIIRLVRRAKLFVFLRQHRHELFDDAFQAELATAWNQSPKGQPPWRLRSLGWRRSCRPTPAPAMTR